MQLRPTCYLFYVVFCFRLKVPCARDPLKTEVVALDAQEMVSKVPDRTVNLPRERWAHLPRGRKGIRVEPARFGDDQGDSQL